MPRSARARLLSWRRSGTRSCWGCSSCAPRPRRRLRRPKRLPAPAKGRLAYRSLTLATHDAKGELMTAALEETRPRETLSRPEAALAKRKRVVIVGGGFAGLAAAHALRHADAEVVLIHRPNHHIFQPLLYRGATAVPSPAEIAAPIRQLEAKQRNVSVILAEVTGVDVASRTIEAASPGAGIRKIAFDYLVVATGMRPSYFGHDEFARYAPGLKSLADAETIRAKILSAFALAATTEDEDERTRQMTFVLVGAGPSGVAPAASFA